MKTRTAYLTAGGLLLLCLLLSGVWLVLRRQASGRTTAVIVWQGEELRRIDLTSVSETELFTTGPEGGSNTIQISPQGIGVIAADCPDQVCVHQGIRSHGPEPIVCLPHKLSIRFEEGPGEAAGLDAVSGR